MHQMEEINRNTWTNVWSLREYGRSEGYLDEGERLSLDIATSAGRPRILDIGVGGGRTAKLLQDKGDYVGIDYAPEMVARARANHPALRFEHMDARDLSAFSDGAFDLATFSYNGIDSVDADGRIAVMREVCRVLSPGGLFVFSTFNRDWSGFARLNERRRIEWTLDPLRLGFRLLRHVEGGLLKALRMRRHAALEVREDDHAILIHSAHDFGIMVHATSYPHLIAQLESAGFERDPVLFDRDGTSLGPSLPANVEYVHVIARKPDPS